MFALQIVAFCLWLLSTFVYADAILIIPSQVLCKTDPPQSASIWLFMFSFHARESEIYSWKATVGGKKSPTATCVNSTEFPVDQNGMPELAYFSANYTGGVQTYCSDTRVLVLFGGASTADTVFASAYKQRTTFSRIDFETATRDGDCRKIVSTVTYKHVQLDPPQCSIGGKWFQDGDLYDPTSNPCLYYECTAGVMDETRIICPVLHCLPSNRVSHPDACCEVCIGVNQCQTHPDTCHSNAICSYTAPSYHCACNDGYSGNGVLCKDIDECAGHNDCGNNTHCVNTEGSYRCDCDHGYGRITPYDCEIGYEEYRIVDPALLECCSHVTKRGMLLVKLSNHNESVLHVENVGCLHGVADDPWGAQRSSTKPFIISNPSQEKAAITFSDALQSKLNSRKNGKRYQLKTTMVYGTGCYKDHETPSNETDTEKLSVYLTLEPTHMYRHTGGGGGCQKLPLNPTWLKHHVLPAHPDGPWQAPQSGFSSCRNKSGRSIASSLLPSWIVCIAHCVFLSLYLNVGRKNLISLGSY